MAGFMSVQGKKTEIVWDLWDEFCQKTSITWECATRDNQKSILLSKEGDISLRKSGGPRVQVTGHRSCIVLPIQKVSYTFIKANFRPKNVGLALITT